MSRRDKVILQHMLDHSLEALSLSQGRSRGDLDSDRLLNLALVRLFEIVGGAAARMPKEDCLRYPQVPWTEIVGLRNRLIHGYDAVDFDVLWQILVQDLPLLAAALTSLLAQQSAD